jgi:hypothetical protein
MSALEWRVTMEAREDPATMNPATVLNLAYELSVVSALGAFLQSKSRAYMDSSRADDRAGSARTPRAPPMR